MARLINVKDLKTQLENLTVKSALLCFIQRGIETKHFILNGIAFTPQDALKLWNIHRLNDLCGKAGKISFFGGPPNSPKWYYGTILTMLCDSILFDEATKGMTLSQKLAI